MSSGSVAVAAQPASYVAAAQPTVVAAAQPTVYATAAPYVDPTKVTVDEICQRMDSLHEEAEFHGQELDSNLVNYFRDLANGHSKSAPDQSYFEKLQQTYTDLLEKWNCVKAILPQNTPVGSGTINEKSSLCNKALKLIRCQYKFISTDKAQVAERAAAVYQKVIAAGGHFDASTKDHLLQEISSVAQEINPNKTPLFPQTQNFVNILHELVQHAEVELPQNSDWTAMMTALRKEVSPQLIEEISGADADVHAHEVSADASHADVRIEDEAAEESEAEEELSPEQLLQNQMAESVGQSAQLATQLYEVSETLEVGLTQLNEAAAQINTVVIKVYADMARMAILQETSKQKWAQQKQILSNLVVLKDEQLAAKDEQLAAKHTELEERSKGQAEHESAARRLDAAQTLFQTMQRQQQQMQEQMAQLSEFLQVPAAARASSPARGLSAQWNKASGSDSPSLTPKIVRPSFSTPMASLSGTSLASFSSMAPASSNGPSAFAPFSMGSSGVGLNVAIQSLSPLSTPRALTSSQVMEDSTGSIASSSKSPQLNASSSSSSVTVSVPVSSSSGVEDGAAVVATSSSSSVSLHSSASASSSLSSGSLDSAAAASSSSSVTDNVVSA